MYKGVFWVTDDELLAFPFDGSCPEGASRSGDTYNHKKLWEHIRPKGSSKSFDYYPRGRVELTNKGHAVIYMSPHIEEHFITAIKEAFELPDDVMIRYDHSRHYRCRLDMNR